MVDVLDQLRDAYDLCKERGQPELQSLLLQIRRKLLEALHESLSLYGENSELHQQLSEAQAEVRELRARSAHPTVAATTPPAHAAHKLS